MVRSYLWVPETPDVTESLACVCADATSDFIQ
jgi:hypothetical protein